ncbi:MAG: S8 family serine peptidase [Candidatus Caenarcaniphilales bacterium]|nr:S8 family serine peptidase [Candidatus Caenarcaniphilales bacterium]
MLLRILILLLFIVLPVKAEQIEIKLSPEADIETINSIIEANQDLKSQDKIKSLQLYKKNLNGLKFSSLNKEFDEKSLDRVYRFECESCDLDSVLKALKKSELCEYIEEDRKVAAKLFSDPLFTSNGSIWNRSYSELWGLETVNASQAWSISEGTNTLVAIIDDGIFWNHPDLIENIWVDTAIVSDTNGDGKVNLRDLDEDDDGFITSDDIPNNAFGRDFYKENNPSSPYMLDISGHGTFIAGIIAATSNNGIGMKGLAHQANILPVKIIDALDNTFSTFDMASAIRYAANQGADAINISLGWAGDSPVIESAIDYANSRGAFVFVAAGNDDSTIASTSNKYPMSYPNVIVVSSIDPNTSVDTFANFGPEVDILAPGSSIVSTNTDLQLVGLSSEEEVDDGLTDNDVSIVKESYFVSQGTSYATPYVAATAALLNSQKSDLTFLELRAILQETSNKSFNSTGKSFGSNVGVLDTFVALRDYQSILDNSSGGFASGTLTLSGNEVSENRDFDSIIGLIGVEDGDFSRFEYDYSIVSDNTNLFKIQNDRSLYTNAALDYEAQSSYTVRIRATAPSGDFLEQDFVIVVINDESDDPKAITIDNNEIYENSSASSAIGEFSIEGGLEFFYDFSLSGVDADKFEVRNDVLYTKESLDYETKSSYSLTVKAVRASTGEEHSSNITVNVLDEDVDFGERNPRFSFGSLINEIELDNESGRRQQTLSRRNNIEGNVVASFKPKYEIDSDYTISLEGNRGALKFLEINAQNQLVIKQRFKGKQFRKGRRLKVTVNAVSERSGSSTYTFTLRLSRR